MLWKLWEQFGKLARLSGVVIYGYLRQKRSGEVRGTPLRLASKRKHGTPTLYKPKLLAADLGIHPPHGNSKRLDLTKGNKK